MFVILLNAILYTVVWLPSARTLEVLNTILKIRLRRLLVLTLVNLMFRYLQSPNQVAKSTTSNQHGCLQQQVLKPSNQLCLLTTLWMPAPPTLKKTPPAPRIPLLLYYFLLNLYFHTDQSSSLSPFHIFRIDIHRPRISILPFFLFSSILLP